MLAVTHSPVCLTVQSRQVLRRVQNQRIKPTLRVQEHMDGPIGVSTKPDEAWNLSTSHAIRRDLFLEDM